MGLAQHCGHALERARAYESERRAHAAAEEAVRARDEFISVASHELRSPITILRGYAQWLPHRIAKAGEIDPARLDHVLRTMGRQSDKLARLIQQLLDTSRLQLGKLEIEPAVTDIGALVREIATSQQETVPAGRIVADLPSDAVWALADPPRLEQIVVNLLDNALKFSQTDDPVAVGLTADATDVILTVRDHGVGIPPAERERIFDQFHQAHPESATKGMGLGLYISKQIVELHGGTISVEAPPDGGSRFVVRLPKNLPGYAEQPSKSAA
jgi:signal transduction histidine kinase